LPEDDSREREAIWVRRAQAGDHQAFAEIVRSHQAAALRLATIICGDTTEAHDIVQEAFTKVYKSLPSLRQTDSLRPWILRVVANEAKNAQRGLRRRDRRIQREIALRPLEPNATEESAIIATQTQALLDALVGLAERDRQIIGCRYLAQLSEHETSVVLGMSIGTVKSQTSRALARLRSEFGGNQ
jgi:RNA polymerase sigma factor (sigma-70 family)